MHIYRDSFSFDYCSWFYMRRLRHPVHLLYSNAGVILSGMQHKQRSAPGIDELPSSLIMVQMLQVFPSRFDKCVLPDGRESSPDIPHCAQARS